MYRRLFYQLSNQIESKNQFVSVNQIFALVPINEITYIYSINEKALRQTQTLRAAHSKAEPKIFAPPQIPSRGRGTAKI